MTGMQITSGAPAAAGPDYGTVVAWVMLGGGVRATVNPGVSGSLQRPPTVPKLLPVRPTQLRLPPAPLPRCPHPVPVLLPSNITEARRVPPSIPSPLLSPRLHSSSSPPRPRSRPSPLLPTPPCLRPARLPPPRRSLSHSLPSPQHLHLSAKLRSCLAPPLRLRALSHREHPLHPLSLDPFLPLGPLLLRCPLVITAAKCPPSSPLHPSHRRTTQGPPLPVVTCRLRLWLRATTCLRAPRGRWASLACRGGSPPSRTVGVHHHTGFLHVAASFLTAICVFKGAFGPVRGPQPGYAGPYPGQPNYGGPAPAPAPAPAPPAQKRLDPDAIPSPVNTHLLILSERACCYYSVHPLSEARNEP